MKHSLFLFLFMIILFSCKNDQSTQEKDTTLDIAISKEPKMIHPFVNPVSSSRPVYQNIFLPMADFHPETYELTPILIEKIPESKSIDQGPYAGGVSYTINLRADAKWANGSPITAKDVLFSIKAILHPQANTSSFKSYLQRISDVQLDENNPRAITVIFKDYYILARELVSSLEVYPQYHYDPENALDKISFAQLIGESAEDIVKSDTALQEWAAAFNSVKYGREQISGPGPYQLKEWIANQRIVLEKKKNYWGDKVDNLFLNAYPEEIVFTILPDATSALTQLKEGNIDMITNISADDFFDLQKNETYKDQFSFLTADLMKLYYIAINNTKPELNDPDVRRALAHLVDIDQLINVIEGGFGKQTIGLFNSKKPYYNSSLKPIEYSLDKAKTILADEGWTDSNNNGTIDKKISNKVIEMELDMHITGSNLSKNIALLFKESAKDVGININIITKKYSDFRRENLKKRDYDLVPLLLGQDLFLDDPYTKWHSDNDDPSKSNDVSYRSDRADDLIEKIRSSRDREERIQYYNDLQEIMYEDQPVIFLYNPMEKFVLNKKWKGSTTMKRPGYISYTFKN